MDGLVYMYSIFYSFDGSTAMVDGVEYVVLPVRSVFDIKRASARSCLKPTAVMGVLRSPLPPSQQHQPEDTKRQMPCFALSLSSPSHFFFFLP